MSEFSSMLAEVTVTAQVPQDTDILPVDFAPDRSHGFIRITVACGACKIRLVPNTGGSFLINGGKALSGDTVYTEDVALDTGRTWNIQCPCAGGTELKLLRIQEFFSTMMP